MPNQVRHETDRDDFSTAFDGTFGRLRELRVKFRVNVRLRRDRGARGGKGSLQVDPHGLVLAESCVPMPLKSRKQSKICPRIQVVVHPRNNVYI